MKFLENVDGKWVIAGLGTMAVFGSFVVGAIFYAILQGLGLNDDLAWAIAMLTWIGVVAASVVAIVSFHKRYLANTNGVERVTIIREVIPSAQSAPQIVSAEPASMPFTGQAAYPASTSPEPFLKLEAPEETTEPESPPFLDEPLYPADSSVSYRTLLAEEGTSDGPESQQHTDHPDDPGKPSVSYRSMLLDDEKKDLT